MASQEHSKASNTSKEEHVHSALNLDATTVASNDVYKTIRDSPKVGQETVPASTDVAVHSDDVYDPDEEQEESDIEKTIKVPKRALLSIYQTIVPELPPSVYETNDSSLIDTSHIINAITSPLYPEKKPFYPDSDTKPLYAEKKPHSVDGGVRYASVIQGKRRRFKLRAVLILLAIVIILIAGAGGLYYSGVRFGASSVPAATLPPVHTPGVLAPAAKNLFVQSGMFAASQGEANSAQQVVYLDPQRHIQLLASIDGQTWQQADLTHLTAAQAADVIGLTSYSWNKGGRQQVAYLDALHHVYLISSGADGHWQVLDLTQRVSAPLSDGMALVGYQSLQTGSQQIIFVDNAHHIQEIESADGINWQLTDLTNLTHTPASDGATLTAFTWTRASEEHIVYVDGDRHVIDLSTTPTGNWQSRDLSKTVRAPLAQGHALVGYEWEINGTMHIDYIDDHNHIQEVSQSLQGTWILTDVTATTNSPVTNGQALVGFDWVQGGSRVLFYIDGNKHIQELSQLPQEHWNEADVTQLTSSPLADGTGLVGYTWPVNGSQQLVFVDATHHLRALSDIANGSWHKVNW